MTYKEASRLTDPAAFIYIGFLPPSVPILNSELMSKHIVQQNNAEEHNNRSPGQTYQTTSSIIFIFIFILSSGHLVSSSERV